jgi:hypothetical protein
VKSTAPATTVRSAKLPVQVTIITLICTAFRSERSTCNLILCSTPSFLEFWNLEACRGGLFHHLTRPDLSALRLVCHGISERVTDQAFTSVDITLRARTFSKPARLAALQRIGHHVKELTFHLPRNMDTRLPPLIDPYSGEQREFVWKPSAATSTKQSRYGDTDIAELLIRQYPPLFHAATNVQSFISAMSSLTNLQHLRVSCLGAEEAIPRRAQGTDIMQVAITSLLYAIERANLKHLDTITLSNIWHTDIIALPSLAMCADPGSAKRWSNVRVLDISMSLGSHSSIKNDQLKLLREYIRGYKGLRRLSFRWIGARGPSPLSELVLEQKNTHPAFRDASPSSSAALFPHLEYLTLSNVVVPAPQIQRLIQTHKSTLLEVDLENVILKDGNWHDALATMNGVDIKTKTPCAAEEGDVPIMLAPSMLLPQTRPKIPKAECKGQTTEATDRARKILLADEIRQRESSGHRSRKASDRDRKRKKVKDTTASPVQQFKRKCGDLLGWRRNGPTLIVA